jgi:tetratricopeptide (TPR) repeat protein
VAKTRDFKPDLDEFILVTTAPEDAKIQQAARLLEINLRKKGRKLSISVWGWDRIEEEIKRHPEAIRHFHPDAQPFTTEILDGQRAILDQLRRQTEQFGQMLAASLSASTPGMPIAADLPLDPNPVEALVNNEIDGYRDLILSDQPRTAIRLLQGLRNRHWDQASARVRFRIISNIGAAHHRLGEQQIAADHFLEAAPYDPDAPASLANKIAALLIKGRVDEAHELAVDAFAKYPGNNELALQRLQARAVGETIEDAWATIPDDRRGTPNLVACRILAMREEGDARWHQLTDTAYAAHPDHPGIHALRLDDVIDRLFADDISALGARRDLVPTDGEIRRTADELEALWQASLGRETPPQPIFAHNAAMLRVVLGDRAAAVKLVEAINAVGFQREETKRLALSLYRWEGKHAEAIRVADTLADSPQARTLRADLRAKSAPTEARELLRDRAAFTEESEVIAAALTVCDSYVNERNYAAAEQEIARLAELLPCHPQVALARYRLKLVRGDADAGTSLDDAAKLVGSGTNFQTRFFVCEALSQAERPRDVVPLLSGAIATSFDSPALRLLVAAYANADQRSRLDRLLKQIPQEVLNKPFYRTARIALAIQAGDIPEALTQIRNYLIERPRDLQLQLQLMQGLFRQHELVALSAQAHRPASDFDGSPEDFIKLAQFKRDFGDPDEGRSLAYRTLLAHPHDALVNMGYVSMFLRGDASGNEDLAPDHVSEGCAVGIAHEDGSKTTYIIEPDPALRPGPEYLAPDRPLAQLLLAHRRGDALTLPDDTNAKLEWIKPRTLHALHSVMERFSNLFPEVQGFERIHIDLTAPNALEPMLERVKQRHDGLAEVTRHYDAGTLPLALLAQVTGGDPVDALISLIESDHEIKSCDGSHQERHAAWKAIADNAARGCVVDAVTLHIIRRLRLTDVVAAVCGPIGIVDATVFRLRQKAHELEQRLDEPNTTLIYRGGQYFHHEVSPDEKRSMLDALNGDLDWISATTTVLPAVGVADPDGDWKSIADRFGTAFLDEVRAAEAADRLLLCEDRLLRGLAQQKFGLRTSWLQPVLMRALERKLMRNDAYLEAVVALIECRLDFVSVDSSLFVQSLRGVIGHVLPPAFEKLAARLGGPKAELRSHLRVAVGAIAQIWADTTLSPTLRAAAVGRILEHLCQGPSLAILRLVLAQLFSAFSNDVALRSYFFAWMRGHFIPAEGS